jgi:hypothetical protein
MALQPLTARELADTPTVFASFMGDVGRGGAGRGYKTVGQLLAIYRKRRKALQAEDPADDLRVDRFIHDMASDGWRDGVVIRIGVFGRKVLVIDGIHRGIAYLACVDDGIDPSRLPALQVDC